MDSDKVVPAKAMRNQVFSSASGKWPRLFFLWAFSLFLATLMPLSLLSFLPLGLIALVYGQAFLWPMMILSAGIQYFVLTAQGSHYFWVSLSCLVATTMNAGFFQWAIKHKWKPLNIVLANFVQAFLIIFGSAAFYLWFKKIELAQLVEGLFNLKQLLKNSDATMDPALFRWFPLSLASALLAMLWLYTALLLRNMKWWKMYSQYPHSYKLLLSYRAPDVLAYPLILGLAATLAGLYMPQIKALQFIGIALLMLLAVFYFFQGLGLGLDVTQRMRNSVGRGPFRLLFNITAMFFVLFVWHFFVLVGVIDQALNLRRFLKNKVREE